jgi:hypothetical protein
MNKYEKYDYNIWSQSPYEVCVTAYRQKPLDLIDPISGAEYETDTEVYTTERIVNSTENMKAVLYLMNIGMENKYVLVDEYDPEGHDMWVSHHDLVSRKAPEVIREMLKRLPDYSLRKTRLVSKSAGA